MKRREFITIIVGAAASAPFVARAQAPAKLPVIGFLGANTAAAQRASTAALVQRLGELGWVDGRNVAIEYRWAEGRFDRSPELIAELVQLKADVIVTHAASNVIAAWAEGQYERLPAMAAELVQKNVAVLAATGAVNATKAAIRSTKTIPVVFANGGDPVALGLVPSLNQPGGNATGVSFFLGGLGAKRLEMMRTLAPGATTVAVLANPANPVAAPELADIEAAGRALGLKVIVLNAGTDAEIDAGFALIAQQRMPALLVNTDSFLSSRRDRITAAAARQSIPAVYSQREFLPAGGLMSYGTSIADGYRQAGVYVGRILKGAKPSELPVLLPTRFELVINLKTAKALGIEIPAGLTTSADEVIE